MSLEGARATAACAAGRRGGQSRRSPAPSTATRPRTRARAPARRRQRRQPACRRKKIKRHRLGRAWARE
eukprot:4009133-Pleurochrysis_carterae.AAC.2